MDNKTRKTNGIAVWTIGALLFAFSGSIAGKGVLAAAST